MSSFAHTAAGPSGVAGRTLALLASLAQVAAMFQPWAQDGVLGVHAGLLSLGEGSGQPTVAVVLVVLAAIAAVPALVGDAAWPRLVSGIGTGALVLVWLGYGPGGHLTVGVLVALGAAVGHIFAAAFATGAHEAGSTSEQQRGESRWAEQDEAPGDAHEPAATRPGHRLVSHTADIIIEAWGPSRAACYGEAVRGLVSSFAETTDVASSERHETVLEADDDEDLLVDVLDEVIYLLDARDVVPVGGNVRDRDDGTLEVVFDLADVDAVRPSGAVPKATTYHELEVSRRDEGWFARATIDV